MHAYNLQDRVTILSAYVQMHSTLKRFIGCDHAVLKQALVAKFIEQQKTDASSLAAFGAVFY